MKCIILAGGRGERLWPLSRKNNPKQFIQIQKNHSVFQETIARNIPYCDEFIIVTNYEYRYIIENQMKAFQGTPYRCVYEEEPRHTTAAILLACLELQPSEFVFVVAADHLIDTTAESSGSNLSYRDAILKAKEYARQGSIVIFGLPEQIPNERFGYISGIDSVGNIRAFFEKPSKAVVNKLKTFGTVHRNLGMLLFQNGSFQNELFMFDSFMMEKCQKVFAARKMDHNSSLYTKDIQQLLDSVSIEKCLIEKSKNIKAISIGFEWSDIGSLEDLSLTGLESNGVSVENDCSNTVIVNQAERQAVVVNELDNILVVNTNDAVYIGRYGKSENLKEILHDNEELQRFAEKGFIYYRTWGFYEQLIEEADYRIRRVTILPGRTIYEHKHLKRSENWMVVKGEALITLDGFTKRYKEKDNIDVPIGVLHQISNIGEDPVVFVETSVGEIMHGEDLITENVEELDESKLGYSVESMVKLSPAFKDYLWGGTKLRDIYGKECDYDIIAESWELSAHPAGQSIVASGKHRGMKFNEYLSTIGKEALGWKCSPLQAFPLLIKFIDAKGDLSVQVHPDDDYALEHENEYGKNEMWYVVDAEPGAGLYVGFNTDVSREEVKKRVQDNTIMETLNFYPTKPGDVFFIPAGTVHAIGAGNLICEIQQSSNCTYRLYDYDRRDKFGNPRELHLEKALDVLDFNRYKPVDFATDSTTSGTVLSRCKYFESIVYNVQETEKISLEDDRFYSVVCINGQGILELNDLKLEIKAGESIFVPAQKGILLVNGKLSIVVSNI